MNSMLKDYVISARALRAAQETPAVYRVRARTQHQARRAFLDAHRDLRIVKVVRA